MDVYLTAERREELRRARKLAFDAAAILDELGELPGANELATAQRKLAEHLRDLETVDGPVRSLRMPNDRRLREAIQRGPLGAIDASALANHYANPRKALADAAADGRLYRVARGIYMPRPRTATEQWKPTVESAAAAVGALTMAQPTPLMGMTAARMHKALPRAISRAWVASPRTHRPMELSDGGLVSFVMRRNLDALDVEMMETELGPVQVTTIEQTIVDLMRALGLGGLESERREVVLALADQTHPGRLHRLVKKDKGNNAAFKRFLDLLNES
ncbi:type IV toxin-antitoxin system AbiEi family antitoxin domain-containing protein [Cellulomonas sp. URHB0016]